MISIATTEEGEANYYDIGDERCRNLVPSPYRSRKAPAKFVRWERCLNITALQRFEFTLICPKMTIQPTPF